MGQGIDRATEDKLSHARIYTWMSNSKEYKASQAVWSINGVAEHAWKCITSLVDDSHSTYYGISELVLESCDNPRIQILADLFSKCKPTSTRFMWKQSVSNTPKSDLTSGIHEALFALDDDSLTLLERVWALGVLQYLRQTLQDEHGEISQIFPDKDHAFRGDLEMSLLRGRYQGFNHLIFEVDA